MAETQEELKSLLVRVKKDSEKSDFHHLKKTKIMASGPITSGQREREKVEAESRDRFYFPQLQNHSGQ